MIGTFDWRRSVRATSRPSTRQPEVEHDQVRRAGARHLQRAPAVARDGDGKAGAPQVVSGDFGDLPLVLDHEDRLHQPFI